MDLDSTVDTATEVGSYFVSNYPPFSVWSAKHVPAAKRLLESPYETSNPNGSAPPLGLYLHIPFCRKRCKFCYFRVFTDVNSRDVDIYLQALAREAAMYAERDALCDRTFDFVYFGGGTPSFLSSEQLQRLVDRMRFQGRWDRAREVTFECEPGTIKKGKLETIKAIGTTRLSLGVEHFDDEVLSLNGRAHKSPEVFRSYDWAREVGFDQINVDLIAGMVGDTESKWKHTVGRALDLQPDSVTVYQMELPHNTVLSHESKNAGQPPPVADWPTKRAWVDDAFNRFEQAGYQVSSAYTLVKKGKAAADPDSRCASARGDGRESQHGEFVYRDAVWRGADLLGLGVASFSHVGGMHFQNEDSWEGYVEAIGRDELPIARALPLDPDERLIRELVLQLKLGRLDAGYFRRKFGAEITAVFHDALASLVDEKLAVIRGDMIRLTRSGLLRVDALLPRFFSPTLRGIRYT